MLNVRGPVASFGAMLGLLLIWSVSAEAVEHESDDYIESYSGVGLTQILFSSGVPSSVFRTVSVPLGGADVDIFLRDCCIRDDIVEVYVDGCFIARVDSQGGDFGTHPGETHTVSLDEGTHTIEYRNVFSLTGPSGWFVSETQRSFTGARPPCAIKDVEVICRPLRSDADDELRINSKVARHCYFLVVDFLDNESTYSAYNDSGILTPLKDAPSDLLDPVACGTGLVVGTFESVCETVVPPPGQSLDSIVAHLEQKIAVGPDDTYNRVTNNSNLWVEQRIMELELGISLPPGAITDATDLAIFSPVIIVRLEACFVNELIIERVLCIIFNVCD